MATLKLLPEQLKFMASTSPIVAYVGGIGSGKSYISCIKAVKNAINGRIELLIGLTYSQARDVLLETLMRVLDSYGLIENKHYKINKSELNVSFIGGGKILIRSAEIGNKLRGLNVSDVFVDESAYLKDREVFDITLGRMRLETDGQMHLTTSPNSFNWLYDIVQDKETDTIRVSTFKNSFLPDQYIKNLLKQYSSKFIQQELYGEFVQLTGSIFNGDWLREDIPDFRPNDIHNCKKIRFYDFAFSEDGDYSAGVLLAKYGEKYVIEDIVRVRQTYTDLRKTIIETAKKDGRDVMIGWEQAGQQKAVISDLNSISELALFQKRSLNVAKHGHKIKRILPLASLAENGNLFIMPACGNKKQFRDECNALTMDDSHPNDDMIDACASAFIMHNTIANGAQGHNARIY